MHLAALLAHHVRAHDERGGADHSGDAVGVAGIARGLDHLVRAVTGQVASCSAASLFLTVPAGTVTVGLPTERAEPHGPVLASLAVPLLVAGQPALLVLQATDAGAFLLLADELHGQTGEHRAIVLDQHLDRFDDATGPALAAGLAELRVVEQAVGALIEQGCSPDEARNELRARAEAEDCDVPAVARQLVADLRRPPPGGRDV